MAIFVHEKEKNSNDQNKTKTSGQAFGHVTVAIMFQHELQIIGLHFAYSFILKCSAQCRLESIYTTDRR